MMSAKEELSFTCNSGYTKSSGTSKCLIQNVLTNDANDARLAPACIKTGSDTVEGNGESYTGTKSTTTTGGECMNWDQVVFEDILTGAYFVGSIASYYIYVRSISVAARPRSHSGFHVANLFWHTRKTYQSELYAENSPEDYALGNHNMCRNPGGSQVTICAVLYII
eukprot:sb/3472451/